MRRAARHGPPSHCIGQDRQGDPPGRWAGPLAVRQGRLSRLTARLSRRRQTQDAVVRYLPVLDDQLGVAKAFARDQPVRSPNGARRCAMAAGSPWIACSASSRGTCQGTYTTSMSTDRRGMSCTTLSASAEPWAVVGGGPAPGRASRELDGRRFNRRQCQSVLSAALASRAHVATAETNSINRRRRDRPGRHREFWARWRGRR